MTDFIPVDFDPFEGPDIQTVVPSTMAQQEVFLACAIGGDDASKSYNESISIDFSGALDTLQLKNSVTAFIQRHEALRAVFSADGQQMIINRAMPVTFVEEDITALTETEKAKAIQEFLNKEVCTVFDLFTGPLFRVSLYKTAQEHYLLTFTAHHIICDGWSLGMFLMETGMLYSQAAILETAPRFSDYAIEQHKYLHSAAYKKNEQYWLSKYQEDVPVMDLPTDRPRTSPRTYNSRRDNYLLPSELVQAVKKAGARNGSSLVNTLLAAFEIFLFQRTRQTNIVIGMPAAGQSSTGYFNLVGHCVNLLPMRSRINPDQSFQEYLKERKKVFYDDFDHQDITFGELLKKLNLSRDPSRIPLTPVVFNIDMGMSKDVSFKGVDFKVISNPRLYENFELFLNATGTDDSLMLEWSYNTTLFEKDTIRKMMADFEGLLQNITINEKTLIRDLDDQIRKDIQLLQTWNQTQKNYNKEICTAALFDEMAAKFPSKIALTGNKKELTYAEVKIISDNLAELFNKKGIKKGKVAGICMERSPYMVVAMLGVQKATAAYLPLDPIYPADRISYMLSDAGASLLICSPETANQQTEIPDELIIDDDLINSLSEKKPDRQQVYPQGEDLCYILYTSGSTGKPKGVMVTHQNLSNFLLSMAERPGMTAEDRLLAITTISFDISCLEIYLPLITGATVVVASKEDVKDGRRILELIAEKNITILQATPATWRMLLESNWSTPFTNLKVISGGEALSKNLAGELLQRCKEVWNAYGPTETTVWSTLAKVEDINQPITVGKPIANTQVYVLDEFQQPVPLGQPGEIYIGGDGVTLGYLNRSELTAEKFVSLPLVTGLSQKLYRTGDMGYFLNTGDIVCQGRVDSQIKIRGYRIEPGEIEYHLLKYTGIQEAVVVSKEDGFGFQKLVAYIVMNDALPGQLPAPASPHHSNSWKEHIQQSLPVYMVPAEFVLLNKIPLTANKKVDRKLLPWPIIASGPTSLSAAPATASEKLLAGIWSELLEKKQIGVDDDFFTLGGHSLIAVQVMARIEKETGKRLPITSLFERPTIKKLSVLLEEQDTIDDIWSSYVPIKPGGTKPPLYIIHGAGLSVMIFNPLAQAMCPQQPVFGLQAKGLDGKEAAYQTIEEMAAHYIDEIIKRNPEGPYALAGYSLGGLIVFEMAKQLRKMGKKVIMVAMLDASAIQSDLHLPFLHKSRIRLYHGLNRIWYTIKLLGKHPLLITKIRLQSLYRRIVWWVTGDKAVFQKEITVPEFYRNAKNVFESTDIAFHQYRLNPEKIDIHLFRAKNQWTYRRELDSKTLGWDAFAKGIITVHEVPGDHDNMFQEPEVKHLARQLQACLDQEYKSIQTPLPKRVLKVV